MQRVEVHGAEAAVGGHLQIGQVLGVQVPKGFSDVGVEGDGVCAGDHGFLERHVFKVAARWAVAQQDAVAVDKGDRGQHETGQVSEALVNLLVQAVALAAENTVPVLHAKRDASEAVVLGDGQVNNLVGLKEGREDGPALQDHTAEIDLAVEIGVGKNDFGALGAGSGLNSGALKAAARLVATDVGDDNPLGSSLPALSHGLSDDFGVGVGGLLRGAVPGDVGLEDDNILAADEAADSTQIFERALNQGARFAVLDNGDVREFGIGPALIGYDTMVTAGLLSLGWGRAEAVFAEPDGGAGRA